MIKAVGEKDGHPMVIAGLSEGNIRNLKKGRPILMAMEVDGQPLEFLIMYGDTEDDIVRELQTHGLRIPTVAIEDEEKHKKHVHG